MIMMMRMMMKLLTIDDNEGMEVAVPDVHDHGYDQYDDDDDVGGGDDGKRNAWQGCDPSSRISSLSVHLFNLIVIKGSTNIIITITICSGCYHYYVQHFCF